MTDADPTDDVSRPTALETLNGMVAQLEAVLEEVSGLGDVVRAIEDTTADSRLGTGMSPSDEGSAESAMIWVREATGWPSLAVRLGLVADTLRSSS